MEVSAFGAGYCPFDIFPNEPTGLEVFEDADVLESEGASFVVEASPFSCDAERLAGSSAHEKIESCSIEIFLCNVANVFVVCDGGVMMSEHGASVSIKVILLFILSMVNLCKAYGLPTEMVPCCGSGFDAAAD